MDDSLINVTTTISASPSVLPGDIFRRGRNPHVKRRGIVFVDPCLTTSVR